MSNQDEFIEAFSASLGIAKGKINDKLAYNTIAQWDSVAHMTLISALENTFDIMLDTNDIINMSSVGKAKEILTDHGINF